MFAQLVGLSLWPVHPVFFIVGVVVLFCYVLVFALCVVAAQADEDMERERQIQRAIRDIEDGMWR